MVIGAVEFLCKTFGSRVPLNDVILAKYTYIYEKLKNVHEEAM